MDSVKERVFFGEEVLSGRSADAVSPVCIIGGGLVGLETAAFLRLYGHEVTVVEMLPQAPLKRDSGLIRSQNW